MCEVGTKSEAGAKVTLIVIVIVIVIVTVDVADVGGVNVEGRVFILQGNVPDIEGCGRR